MICFETTGSRWVERYPKSTHFCGCPTSASASLLDDGAVPMSLPATANPACSPEIIAGMESATVPAYPPLPVPSKRPFHVAVGIHSSMLISESELGVSVALTLQN